MADPLRSRLQESDEAAAELIAALQRLRDALRTLDLSRADGTSVSRLVSEGPGREARSDVRAAWIRLSHALKAYRAESVRLMVEQEGMTVAEVARLTRNARQVISRLYHSSPGSQNDGQPTNPPPHAR
jgi:hypothetical protein